MNIRPRAKRRFTAPAFGLILAFTGILCAQISLDGLDEMVSDGGANPASQSNSADQPVTLEFDRAIHDGDSLIASITFRMKPDIHFYSAESLFFKFDVSDVEGMEAVHVELPEPKDYTNFDGAQVKVFTDGHRITLHAPLTAPKWRLVGSLRYQACDDTQCFLPVTRRFQIDSEGAAGELKSDLSLKDLGGLAEDKPSASSSLLDQFEVTGKAGGYMAAEKFVSFLQNPSSGGGLVSFAGKAVWIVILLTILGGIALNLTPCVLPMMPITLAVLGAGAHAQSKKRGLLVGAMYGLGMTLSYGIAGTAIILSGATFGTLNSSPLFNAAIAILFILLALGMFDIIHIDFSRFRSKIKHDEQKRGSLPVAFFMGSVAALLAGACVAPVVISVVLYATSLYGEGQMTGLLLPFMLGAGMALPWPFAGAGLSFLPKPGGWMAWVRNGFGALILVIALYYGYTAVQIWRNSSRTVTETHSNTVQSLGNNQLNWHHSLEEGLAAAVARNKPVFIDFWATWCKNCKAMDATTFRNPRVREEFESFILVKYQAENPDAPETKAVLNHFDVVGLPSYVILDPRQVAP